MAHSNHSGIILELNSTQLNSTHDVGIPIGNLTSQFFANVYLNGFDHFIKEQLKCRIFQTEHGVPFLGFIMAPECRRLKKPNVTRFKRRLKNLQELYRAGEIEWQSVHQSANAWIGHAKHGNTKQLREDIFSEHIFQREG